VSAIRVGLDLNGTIDEDPVTFQSLMEALMAAGHQVVVLTGCSSKKVTPKDIEEKAEYLNSIGCGHCYDKLRVFGDPPHKAKAKWIHKHKLDLYIDNSVQNCQLAAPFTTDRRR
jgi:hypothetical protein